MPGPSSHTIRTFQTADAEPLAALIRESLATGEQAGHTSSDGESIIDSFAVARNLLVADLDGEPVGIISPQHRFIVVRPDVRRRGIGRALVETAEEESASSLDGPVILFPPHESTDALDFLNAIGFRYDHSMWRLRLDPNRHEIRPQLPADFALIGLGDVDLVTYVELINTVFLDHPVTLHVSLDQVEFIHAGPNFDPADIALVRSSDGELAGFCVTGANRIEDPPIGIINLLGVQRAFRGSGLGRFLLIWGIERLRETGLDAIELGVEAENENAVGLYRSVGFDIVEEWPQWMRARTA